MIETEADTRANRIDPVLHAAGWGVVEGSKVNRELICPGRITAGGARANPLSADYVLSYRDRKLAVIEAKRAGLGHTDGVGQAKDYAIRLKARFAYSTNGISWYGIDMQTGVEGDHALPFPTPEELWQRCFPEGNDWRDRFGAVPFETGGGKWQPRYYQHNAITAVLEAIAQDRDRILLTLATGTGKTSIAFQIAWKLFHASWNLGRAPTRRPRILFLADRNILADQAYNAFSAFPPDALARISPDEIRKKGKVPKNASVFFTIFQTFMTGTGEFTFQGYPPDFFDLIVIDECHRGGANDESTWRAILEYFRPAVQLGLTATPKRGANADTYAYFGDPVYTYALKEGIGDGFLTPFKVRQMASTLDTYRFSDEDDVVSGEIDPDREYTEADFNTRLVIDERELSRVHEFMDQIDQRQKTLVFCATQDHAARVRNFINQVKDNPDPHYCERVTANDGKVGEQHLREFQDNEKTLPTILATSHKLSTGVDARNVRNIVLLRPIKSMIEFKQIIGRGTRINEDYNKFFFTIMDFKRATALFADPAFDGDPVQIYEPGPNDPPVPPDEPPLAGDEDEARLVFEPPGQFDPLGVGEPPPMKYYVDDVEVTVVTERVQYLDEHGRLITESLKDYTRKTVRKAYTSLNAFLNAWNDAERKQAIIEELSAQGVFLDELAEQVGHGYDAFDLVCHVAFDQPPLTRRERAEQVKKRHVFARYGEQTRAVLDALLEKYADGGIKSVESLEILKVDPLTAFGTPVEIVKLFGGKQNYLAAIRELETELYFKAA